MVGEARRAGSENDSARAAPSTQACRAALDRILRDPAFGAERDRKFLSYVVEEALAGRGERIKAYTVAIEVFGRDESSTRRTIRSSAFRRDI